MAKRIYSGTVATGKRDISVTPGSIPSLTRKCWDLEARSKVEGRYGKLLTGNIRHREGSG